MTENAPHPPLTEMAAAAATLHELFTSYLEAGFTRAEALELIKTAITPPRPPSD